MVMGSHLDVGPDGFVDFANVGGLHSGECIFDNCWRGNRSNCLR